jgi:transcriptional regulator with XRE-family HTH domain
MVNDSELRERVREERRLRGLSVRAASTSGGVSNTAWGEWERGIRPLTGGLRVAVAQTFGWASDWPENPPPRNHVEVIDLDARLDRIEAMLSQLVGLPAAVEELVLSIHSMLKSDLEEEQLQGADRPVEQRRTGSSS